MLAETRVNGLEARTWSERGFPGAWLRPGPGESLPSCPAPVCESGWGFTFTRLPGWPARLPSCRSDIPRSGLGAGAPGPLPCMSVTPLSILHGEASRCSSSISPTGQGCLYPGCSRHFLASTLWGACSPVTCNPSLCSCRASVYSHPAELEAAAPTVSSLLQFTEWPRAEPGFEPTLLGQLTSVLRSTSPSGGPQMLHRDGRRS